MTRRRGRGKKLPTHETKSSIIYYLAREGKMERRDIHDFIRKNHNIVDVKTIDKHLQDLICFHIIRKNEIRPGLAISYQLIDGVEGLNNSFNFIKGHNQELKFLSSPYAINQINEEILLTITRKIVISCIPTAIKLLIYPKEKLAQEKDIDVIIGKWGIFILVFKQLIQFPQDIIPVEKIDEIYNQLKNEIEKEMMELSDVKLSFITQIFFPKKERNDILNILKTSPTAFNYLMNIDKIDLKGLSSIIGGYFGYYTPALLKMLSENEDYTISFFNYLSSILKIKKQKRNSVDAKIQAYEDNVKKFDILKNKFKFQPEKFFELINSMNKNTTTPLLIISKSFLNTDIYSDNFVRNEWVEQYYKNMLIDENELNANIANLGPLLKKTNLFADKNDKLLLPTDLKSKT